MQLSYFSKKKKKTLELVNDRIPLLIFSVNSFDGTVLVLVLSTLLHVNALPPSSSTCVAGYLVPGVDRSLTAMSPSEAGSSCMLPPCVRPQEADI